MNFRVFWTPHAEKRLEAIVRNQADYAEIAGAARQIDRSLATYPIEFGESRYDTVRIGFALPLGVQYEILDDVRTVIAYDVWRVRSRT
jgi:hypothetical protein